MDLKALPAELAHFVQQALARGTYQSEEELMAEAVRVLKARVSRQEAG
jgi:Arc/MetJ-type ribon-helix-helix transcriptional regulator